MRRAMLLHAILLLVLGTWACAATTAFTYQGKLTDSAGVALTGSYDMTFKLYDALTGGNQVGSTVTLTGVSVSGGLFTVSLDFGASAFNTGEARWIETTVGTTSLSPRVAITSVPTAIYAQSVPWSGVTGVPASLPPSGTAGGDLTGTYPNPTIATGAVTSAKILDGTVALADMASNSVDSSKVVDGSISSSDLASDAASLAKVTGGIATATSEGVSIAAGAGVSKPFQVIGSRWTLDQSQEVATTGMHGASYNWQSFTAGATGNLVGVSMFIGATDGVSPWTVVLGIYQGEGTDGTRLSSQTISGDGEVSIRTFSLSTPVALTAGTKYTIVKSMSFTSTMWRCTSDVYAGGQSYYAAYDFWFRTYMEPATPAVGLSVQAGTMNVGIGTAGPAAKLDVAGTAKMTGFQLGTAATAGQVLTTDTTGVGTWQALPTSLPPSGTAGGDLTGTYPNPTIATGAVTSAKILDGSLASADIADGTIALADMAANSVNASKIVDASVGSADLASDAASLNKVTGGAAVVSGGNIGIGTTTPSYDLHVNGTVGIVSLPQADKRNVQWDPTTGQLYQAVSSRRYKDNITPLQDDFKKLLLAEPKTYTYKSCPGIWEIGYIAEEIDALGLKWLVDYDNQGRPDALKYEKMVLYLNEIAKDQQKQIEALQNRDADKDAKIADLQKQIDELRKLVADAVKTN